MGRKEIVCQGYFMFCLPAYFKKAGLPLGTFKKKKNGCNILFLLSAEKEVHFKCVYVQTYIYHQKQI